MKLIDLSFPLEHGQLNFPWDPKISIVPHNSVTSIGYNITHIGMSTHQGTHLDAPFHFYDDGTTIDGMELHQFFGKASLVDLAPGSSLAPGTPLTLEMFKPHSAKFTAGARIIYRTGWDRMFGKPEYFSSFPTLTLDAAQWMADRKIGMIGMDTPTPSTSWKECHLILLKKGVEILIVEGLTRLEQLPGEFTFIGFPLNIKGRDGSPIRAVAMVGDPS